MAQVQTTPWATYRPDLPSPMATEDAAPLTNVLQEQPSPEAPNVFAPTPPPITQGQEEANYTRGALHKVRSDIARPYGFAGAPPSAEFPEGLAPNHPGIGGKIGHAFANLANVAGEIFAPGVTENIGSSQLGMQKKEGDLAKRLNTEISDESLNQERGANTARTQEENVEAPQKAADTHALTQSTIDKNEKDKAVTLQQAHANAVQRALDAGRDPSSDPTVNHLADAITGLLPGQNKEASAPKTETFIPPGGSKPMTFQWNPKTSKYDIPLGEHYERPITVTTGESTKNLWSVLQPDGTRKAVSIRAGDIIPKGAVSLSGQNTENVGEHKEDRAEAKLSEQLDSELGLMKQFAAQPSPTNDAAMLMHYIGATKPESMGKIRLNDRELKLFGGTRSSLGDAEALLTKVVNGQSLTPKQRSDMVNTMTMISQAAKRGGEGGGPAPAGADNEVYVGGKLAGHTVGGKYVPLGGK